MPRGKKRFFIYVLEEVNFLTARSNCEIRGATLGRISDNAEFDFAREFMDEADTEVDP